MPLVPGTRLGPYEVVAALGAGGMGEVYKARDTRLDRTVAIKILPETLSSDRDFRERFDREARTISQLEHPHICALHDVGEQGGTAFLVMQYLEGETLADRIKKSTLPLDQILQYTIQIADALDTAHRAGIVHRDLKPANIMLTKTGAKLLDFGLAKINGRVVAGAGFSMLPTTPQNLTAAGTILGTFQYMAPEQLEGQDADARTDIFAFGAVVYEMVTGQKAFAGKSQASLIASILTAAPPSLVQSQPLTPPALEHLVRVSLAKDPDARWQSMRDVHRELIWIAEVSSRLGEVTQPTLRHRRRTVATAGLLGILGMAAASGLTFWMSARPRLNASPIVRFAILLKPGTRLWHAMAAVALSPDGRSAVIAADDGTGPQLSFARWIASRSHHSAARPGPRLRSSHPTVGGWDSGKGAGSTRSPLAAVHRRKSATRRRRIPRPGARTARSSSRRLTARVCRGCRPMVAPRRSSPRRAAIPGRRPIAGQRSFLAGRPS